MGSMRGLMLAVVCWNTGVAVVAAQSSVVHGQAQQRETLRGVTGVWIVVEALSPNLEQGGLTQRQLQADTERRLQAAGISVLTKQEWRMTPGTPWLYVRVSTVRTERGTYAYSVDVLFKQEVVPTRDPYIETPLVDAVTWDTGRVGYTGAAGLWPIRESVAHCVDTFINAYLAVNPQ